MSKLRCPSSLSLLVRAMPEVPQLNGFECGCNPACSSVFKSQTDAASTSVEAAS